MIKHPATTYFYQLLAEGIIIFLILYPFTYDYYSSNHYTAYLLVLVLLAGCFYLGEQVSLLPLSYGLGLLLAGGLLYVFHFPLGLVLLLPILFLFRYTAIRSYKRFDYDALYLHNVFTRYERNPNKIYLHVTLVLTFIVFFITKKSTPFFFFFIQIMILLTGFLISHVQSISKEDRKDLRLRNFYFFPLGLLVIASFSFLYFQGFHRFFRFLWHMILYSFVNLSAGVSSLVAFFFPNIEGYEMSREEWQEWGAGIEEARKNMLKDLSADETDFTLLIILILVIFLLLLFILIWRSVKKGSYKRRVKVDQEVIYLQDELALEEDKSLFRSPLRKLLRRNNHPVRKLIFEFEAWAKEKGYGRYSYESLTDWLNRLDLELDIRAYKRVRYGNEAVTKEEVEALRLKLAEVRLELESRS